MSKYLTGAVVVVIVAGLAVVVALRFRPVGPVDPGRPEARPTAAANLPRTYRPAYICDDRPIFTRSLTAVAVGPEDRVYAAGDTEVRVFDHCARPVARYTVAAPPLALAVAGEYIYIGQSGQVEKRLADGSGQPVFIGRGTLKVVAGLAVVDGQLFVADAATKRIDRFGADGTVLGQIVPPGTRGAFRLPSGRIDVAADPSGNLVVAHSGVHRVDTFTPAGELVRQWGQQGRTDPAAFPGCCNPVNIAVAPTGEIITAEKGGPRVKVFTAAGTLLGLIGPEHFHADNMNMDLAVDSGGRIYVADTEARTIRLFTFKR